MPKQAVIAEIGVAEGAFSHEILQRALPRKLHLIDPWLHQEAEDYARDPNNVGQDAADLRHLAVAEKFRHLIDAGFVEIHRAFSQDAVADFPDGYFDWIYVDAKHTYEACLNDLQLYDAKVKADGFICGHDYANHPGAQKMDFGVVEAVNEFIEDSGYEFILLTYELFPMYVVAKDPDSFACQVVRESAAAECGVVMEIGKPEQRNYQQVILSANGKSNLHYRFG